MAALRIPTDLSTVDPAWLGEALGVRVIDVADAGPTGGIPVTSRVARLRLTTEPAGTGPDAVVVKVMNPAWTEGSDLHEREVHFYREFAVGKDLPVPRCYYADYDPDTGAFVLVLEDLGHVEPGHRLDGLTAAEADAVADGLADLHRTWWQRHELRALKVRGHDAERIARTVATFDERWRAVEATGKFAMTDELRAVQSQLRARYADGMLAISSEPQTLIHSDLHVENFFLQRADAGLRLIAIDWQNACFGNAAFDVSHVLTSMRPELDAGARDRVVARYHARLAVPDLSLPRLREHVAASVRHQFVGSAYWFATFEAESMRDAATIQDHWTRLCAAVIATEAPRAS